MELCHIVVFLCLLVKGRFLRVSRKSYSSPNSLQSIGFSTAAIASASAESMPYLV